jgi:zinc protease
MFALALLLLFQVNDPAGPIQSPFKSREDVGVTSKVVLRNGLTLIVRENPSIPLTAITTVVKAGYFDEEDRISGISHVIEHMFFKGTPSRPVGEIARETKSLGGYLNASTYYDRTTYYTVVPSENTIQAMEIQADALWHSSFDSDELRREIEVVLQENNRKLDNPSAVASEKLYEVAFQQHRMKRWRIGTPAGLRALTRDDLVAYFKRYYRPSNIVLSIVGPMDRNQVITEAIRLYGDVSGDSTDAPIPPDAKPIEPPQSGLRLGSQRGPIEQAHIAVGFHTPGVLDPEYPALQVLATILSQGRTGRLNQYLRDEKSLITSADASTNAFLELGFFEIDFETAKPQEAQAGVLAELESLKKFGVTNESVSRAKSQIALAYVSRLETVDGIARDLALNEALGDWKRSTKFLSDIDAVTSAAVVDAAKKYLTSANLSVFEYLPDSTADASTGMRPLSVENYQSEILAKLADMTPQHKEAELTVSAKIPVLEDSFIVSAVKPIEKRAILRGPDVYIAEDHRLPLVTFGIFYPGGRLLETSENSGITELALRSALRGAARLNSADIARRLENAGASIQVVNDSDFFGYIVEGLSGRMNQALEVLIEVIQQPVFDPQEVEREKVLQLSRIRNLRDDNYAYPVRLFLQTLFGSHPYSRPAVGTAEAVGKLTSNDVQKWFRENQRKVVPVIVIAGDTNGTSLIAPLTERLTNEDLTERSVSKMQTASPLSRRAENVESINRQQTALVYGFAGATLTSAEQFPMVVFRNIVSGLGGRFFDTIREKQGLAYTVSTANAFYSRGGAVFTYAAFSPENESAVRASLEQEIDGIRKDGVTAEEVRKAIAYSVGDRERQMETHQSLVLEYARAVISGAGVASVPKYSDQIRQVTPKQIQDAVRKFLDPAQLRVAIVRGEKKTN